MFLGINVIMRVKAEFAIFGLAYFVVAFFWGGIDCFKQYSYYIKYQYM